nr:RNA-binding protein 42-like isoform X1 [Ipomoea trifida]
MSCDLTILLCFSYYHRLFCGDDLGNEVKDDVLSKAFSRFPSFNMVRVELSLIFCFGSAAREDDREGKQRRWRRKVKSVVKGRQRKVKPVVKGR